MLASIGSMPEDEAWIYFALNLAKGYVGLACGELLSGCKIQIQWHDHELGSHPFLCLSTKAYIQEKYITAAEYALRVFDGVPFAGPYLESTLSSKSNLKIPMRNLRNVRNVFCDKGYSGVCHLRNLRNQPLPRALLTTPSGRFWSESRLRLQGA